jgi:hypothetical protein
MYGQEGIVEKEVKDGDTTKKVKEKAILPLITRKE